jgi:hypothetical protein
MKKIIILLLCLMAIGSNAKTTHLRDNGKKVAVTPHFDRPYTIVQDPPCYEYKRHGLMVMECPGILFTPEITEKHTAHENTNDEDEAVTGEISVHSERTYTGYAHTSYTMPELKNNGRHVAITPEFNRPYTVVQDPPCYLYKRHGRVVMECPGILFAPNK